MRTPLLLILFAFSFAAQAQVTYTPAFSNIDFDFPVEIQSPADGTDRMFVVEQAGRIKVFPRKDDVNSGEVSDFLNITDRVSFGGFGQEIGLLGLAFHPDYTSNGYFYVYYTTNSPVPGISVRMVLSRFSVDNANSNLADPDSELIVFQFDKNQNNSNHNGGKIAFGPDGYLYVSIGDGGGGNDPQRNGQNTGTIFGNICRIDVDLDGSNPIETNPSLPNGNYEIPADNPFAAGAGLDEIYAYGIRNTWKFSFDEPTGRLWGADVGQNAFEEINLIKNGENYGWSRFEGISIANSNVVINETTTFPVLSYNRSQGDISITGGYVYRGSEISSLSPDISSRYIFGDFVSGRVWALDYNPTTGNANRILLFRTNGQNITSFGLDNNGELYFSDYGTNAQIYKLVDGTTPSPGVAISGVGEWQPLNEGIINGEINAIATAANGNVYHGGKFNSAGNLTTRNIAVWNETTGWGSLGSGSNGTINALTLAPNGDLYAGGSFTEIGGVAATNIAQWDGTAWAAVGNGVDGPILALEVDQNGDLFAAGIFETIDGTGVRNIGRWDGTQWTALKDQTNDISGTNNEIRSLHIGDNGVLYVGGNFDEAGGNSANRIARWDGANWGTLGDGTSGFVQAITSTAADIYVGGNFGLAGGQTVNRIAVWNIATSTWSDINGGLNNNVNTLLHDGTYLYAAGAFSIAFDNNKNSIVNNIGRWSDTNGWEALGKDTQVGVDIKINDMAFASDADGVNKIYAGGNFSEAGAQQANNAALWASDKIVYISQPKDIDDFAYFPNPTAGMLYLSGKHNWVLTNSLGQTISMGNSAALDMSDRKPGIYYLNIDGIKTVKVTKR